MPTPIHLKYRPKKFKDIIGQEIVVKTLKNAVSLNMINHAYLFAGPRGSGKTSTARIFAKAVNCASQKEGEPCGKCEPCKIIQDNKTPDIIEIDAASNRGIDEIRELKESIRYPPSYLKYKVYIIDEAHQLTKEAVNALLKVVEEPPKYVVFILATTEEEKVMPTLKSRCQRFDFRKLSINEITKKLENILKEEKIDYDKDAIELLAVLTEGAMRDAEVLLGQAINYIYSDKHKISKEIVLKVTGGVDTAFIKQLFSLALSKDAKKSLELLNKIIAKGAFADQVLKLLIRFVRMAIIYKIDPEFTNEGIVSILTKEDQIFIKKHCEKIDIRELQRLLDLFLDAIPNLKYSPIQHLPIETALIKFSLKNENKPEKNNK